MHTTTHPIDYRKRIVLVSRLVRVCARCGGYPYIRPVDNARVCINCGGSEMVEVWEHMLDTFRKGLAEIKAKKVI